MIVQCETCGRWFDDEYRSYICPHDAFPANDGDNNFVRHTEAYLSDKQVEKQSPADVSNLRIESSME